MICGLLRRFVELPRNDETYLVILSIARSAKRRIQSTRRLDYLNRNVVNMDLWFIDSHLCHHNLFSFGFVCFGYFATLRFAQYDEVVAIRI